MKPIYKKLFLAVIFLVFIIATFFIVKNNFVKNNAPKYTGPVEKVTIGNVGEYSIFNLIALNKGYFKENGLDVTIEEYSSGPPAIDDLLAGKIDFAIAADFVGVRNIFTNPDLRIVTQANKHKVFHVIARKDKGVLNTSDLKGKTIGVTKKGAGEFYLGRFLTFNNLELKDITIHDLTPQQMITQLENGTIDAIVIFDPHAYNLQKKLGDSIIQWSAQGEQNIFALMYSTNTYLSAHPDTTVRLMRALLQAEDYVRQNTTEIQTSIAKELNYDPEYVNYLWPNFIANHALDQELLLTMEDEARWSIKNNLTDQKKVPNYLDYIYFDALEKTKPDAITIIR